jgi:hypothetical protein
MKLNELTGIKNYPFIDKDDRAYIKKLLKRTNYRYITSGLKSDVF